MTPTRPSPCPAPRRQLGLWKAFWLVFVLGGHGFAVLLVGLLCWAETLGWGNQLGHFSSALLLAPLVLAVAALPVLMAPDGEGQPLPLLAKAWAGLTAVFCLHALPLAALLLLSRLLPETSS